MTLPISVVIPTYNTPTEILARAIQSAIKAGAGAVHVVDDGSDSEYDVSKAYPQTDSITRVYVYENARGGVCHARNVGVDCSPYNLIVPLDADDELLPGGLQFLYGAWQHNTLVYGGWIEITYHISLKEIITRTISAPPSEMLTRKNVAHATWLFHGDDWQRVGGYDPDFNIGGEDYAFMVALVNAGVKPIRVDVPIYRKHIRGGSRTDAARSRYPFIQQLLREKYPTFFR